jgi:hypothetical protein
MFPNAPPCVASEPEVVDSIMAVSIDQIGRWGPKDRAIGNVVIESTHVPPQLTLLRAVEEADTAVLPNPAGFVGVISPEPSFSHIPPALEDRPIGR